MKTLIITSTNDATTDLLIAKIGSENIFRLNYDIWHSYSFELNKKTLAISNDFHSLTELGISKVYWRKPFTSNFSFDEKLDNYLNKEITCAFKDLYNIFKESNKTVLVDPIKSANLGKLYQLRHG